MRAAKITYKILLIILPLLISSCVEVEDYYSDYTGETVPVQIKINVNGESDLGDKDIKISRKAPSNINENLVSDIWVIQFNGTTTSSTKVYTKYINITTSTLGLNLAASSSINRVVIIANTHNSNFDFSSVTTYQNLLDKMASITNEYDAYGGSSNLGIVMSGFSDIIVNNVVSSTPINFTLIRSVAKVVLNLNLTSTSGLTIDSVVMCDVPNQFNIVDTLKALHNTISVPYPVHASTTYKTFASTTNLPTAGGTTQTFQWYVPRNMKGTNAGTAVTNKNANAPDGASYIRIYAKSGSDIVIFRVYPGANMTNDFNIIPNKRYIINIKLNSMGDYTADSRIEIPDAVIVDYTSSDYSNCYILNPPSTGQPVKKYRIPVGRVDEYWGSSQTGYGNNSSNLLSTSNSWTVSLLWQDLSNLVQASGTSNIALTKTTGLGKNDYFEITVPSSAQDGNFVIKIDKGGSTLWSWHFWVTNYDPYYNQIQTGEVDKYYIVNGGEIYRYAGPTWTSGGELQNSYALDRNIGQLSATYTPANNKKGTLYYQYGRKDPFPANITLYNIAGGTVTYSTSANRNSSTVAMSTTVNNPLTFYGGISGITNASYIWNDYNVSTSSTAKSIFDPSPWGFKLPKTGVWSNFTTSTFTWTTNYRRYDPSSVYSYYYADGYRTSGAGTLSNVASIGYYWNSSPSSTSNAYNMNFRSNSLTSNATVARANGYVCRPVRE